MTAARDLADRFHQRWLTENPFSASMYGIPGYDDLVPDESEEGAQAWRAEVEGFLAEGDAIDPGPLTAAIAARQVGRPRSNPNPDAVIRMAPVPAMPHAARRPATDKVTTRLSSVTRPSKRFCRAIAGRETSRRSTPVTATRTREAMEEAEVDSFHRPRGLAGLEMGSTKLAALAMNAQTKR